MKIISLVLLLKFLVFALCKQPLLFDMGFKIPPLTPDGVTEKTHLEGANAKIAELAQAALATYAEGTSRRVIPPGMFRTGDELMDIAKELFSRETTIVYKNHKKKNPAFEELWNEIYDLFPELAQFRKIQYSHEFNGPNVEHLEIQGWDPSVADKSVEFSYHVDLERFDHKDISPKSKWDWGASPFNHKIIESCPYPHPLVQGEKFLVGRMESNFELIVKFEVWSKLIRYFNWRPRRTVRITSSATHHLLEDYAKRDWTIERDQDGDYQVIDYQTTNGIVSDVCVDEQTYVMWTGYMVGGLAPLPPFGMIGTTMAGARHYTVRSLSQGTAREGGRTMYNDRDEFIEIMKNKPENPLSFYCNDSYTEILDGPFTELLGPYYDPTVYIPAAKLDSMMSRVLCVRYVPLFEHTNDIDYKDENFGKKIPGDSGQWEQEFVLVKTNPDIPWEEIEAELYGRIGHMITAGQLELEMWHEREHFPTETGHGNWFFDSEKAVMESVWQPMIPGFKAIGFPLPLSIDAYKKILAGRCNHFFSLEHRKLSFSCPECYSQAECFAKPPEPNLATWGHGKDQMTPLSDFTYTRDLNTLEALNVL